MTKEFEKLLEYLTFAVFGRKNETVSEISIDAVCNVSMKQGIFPLVFGALSAEEKKLIDKKWQVLFFQAMIKNEQKMAALVPIFKKLDEYGIRHCILKGCTIAQEYHLSECRLSGDIDLYVDPKDEAMASKALKELGMSVEPRPADKQDFKVTSPQSGIIEVHVFLHKPAFQHIVLKDKFGVTEPFRKMNINDFLTVNALGIQDNLNFLTAHLLKHFVREGCGIRQVTDLLAFIENHKAEIDFDKYFADLEELKFKKLILNVFGIGVKYFGLDFEQYSTDGIDNLLDDFEVGENFGYGEVERQGFYEQFIKNRTNDDKNVRNNLVTEKRHKVLRAVFLPSRKYLIDKGFGYLEKSAILYPVAYFHRFGRIAKNMITGKRKYKKAMGFAEKNNDIMKKRMEMMRKLEVID